MAYDPNEHIVTINIKGGLDAAGNAKSNFLDIPETVLAKSLRGTQYEKHLDSLLGSGLKSRASGADAVSRASELFGASKRSHLGKALAAAPMLAAIEKAFQTGRIDS